MKINLGRIAAEMLQMSWSCKGEREGKQGGREGQSEGEEYTEMALPGMGLNNSGEKHDQRERCRVLGCPAQFNRK